MRHITVFFVSVILAACELSSDQDEVDISTSPSGCRDVSISQLYSETAAAEQSMVCTEGRLEVVNGAMYLMPEGSSLNEFSDHLIALAPTTDAIRFASILPGDSLRIEGQLTAPIDCIGQDDESPNPVYQSTCFRPLIYTLYSERVDIVGDPSARASCPNLTVEELMANALNHQAEVVCVQGRLSTDGAAILPAHPSGPLDRIDLNWLSPTDLEATASHYGGNTLTLRGRLAVHSECYNAHHFAELSVTPEYQCITNTSDLWLIAPEVITSAR